MEGFVGFGPEGQLRFAVRSGKEPSTTAHFAFQAESRATVDAFHAVAIAGGGTDAGPPGVREHYHPNYYAAFVGDPDGSSTLVIQEVREGRMVQSKVRDHGGPSLHRPPHAPGP